VARRRAPRRSNGRVRSRVEAPAPSHLAPQETDDEEAEEFNARYYQMMRTYARQGDLMAQKVGGPDSGQTQVKCARTPGADATAVLPEPRRAWGRRLRPPPHQPRRTLGSSARLDPPSTPPLPLPPRRPRRSMPSGCASWRARGARTPRPTATRTTRRSRRTATRWGGPWFWGRFFWGGGLAWPGILRSASDSPSASGNGGHLVSSTPHPSPSSAADAASVSTPPTNLTPPRATSPRASTWAPPLTPRTSPTTATSTW
jgi:hypothetical protein